MSALLLRWLVALPPSSSSQKYFLIFAKCMIVGYFDDFSFWIVWLFYSIAIQWKLVKSVFFFKYRYEGNNVDNQIKLLVKIFILYFFLKDKNKNRNNFYKMSQILWLIINKIFKLRITLIKIRAKKLFLVSMIFKSNYKLS